jgi:hypothetical protein
MPDLFSTNNLTAVVNSLQMPPSFLLGTFFPNVQTETSEEIHFDFENDVMGLAPFVSPLVEGRVVEAQGFITKTFQPAYIKAKTPFQPNIAIKRYKGEPIGGNLSPEQRMQRIVTDELINHRRRLDRRLEWMAASALRLGAITVSGEKYQTTVVNFGRDSALTVALSTPNKWGESGVKPLDSLQTWGELIFEKSGSAARNVVMDINAWKVFRADSEVKQRLDLLRATGGGPMRLDAKIDDGGTYMGTIDGFNIWVYSGTYKDDSGNLQKMLPSGTVIMAGDLMGYQAYGAIMDEAAGMQALPFFTKSWLENDPSVRMIMTQSAPLVVPYRPNASLCATVL